MTRPRVGVVVGTRPDAIKQAPVHLALRDEGRTTPVLLASGQHAGILDDVLDVFGLVPDDRFDALGDGGLVDLHGRLVAGLGAAFDRLALDAVVVQGDTLTTMTGALVAGLRGMPVAHVEAGLRTGVRGRPFPEELSRRLVGQLADLHFPPTARAANNLAREGIDPGAIHVVGNTGIDALRLVSEGRDRPTGPRSVLVTAHRRENWDGGIARVCRAVAELAGRHPDVVFRFPVHPNPRVADVVHDVLDGTPNVDVRPAVPYPDLAAMLVAADVVLTDSGGIQEEAASLGIPTLVLRDETERPEAVDAGVAVVVGTDEARIVDLADTLLTSPDAHAAMARPTDAFGDGHAAERIARVLADHLAGPT